MHAVGLMPHGRPAGKLRHARSHLLDWLAGAAAGHDVVLRVVFDAQTAPAASPEADHRGVRVRFASGQTADDEIEELLAAESLPGRVTVVSNDSRVQDAGRRRGAAVQTCQEFVDWLINTNREQGTDAPRSP